MFSYRRLPSTINMFCQLPLLALAAVTAAHPPSWGPGPAQHDQLTVQTTSGSVHGKINSTYPNVRQFLGIPFAQPPLGDLRWAPPQPLSQPDAKIEATEIGPSCIQYFNTNSSGVYRNQVLEYNLQGLNRTGDISEDCLKLSVWAPTREKGHGKGRDGRGKSGKGKGLPVLVYFYGGGFSKYPLGACIAS
jgi:carboxylesterase type B